MRKGKEQTAFVIQVLDDSNRRSIEYKNRVWLRQNVNNLGIRVCIEDCIADVFDIVEAWKKENSILIQDGEKVKSKGNFHPGKEALLLINYQSYYSVFLYSPKD